MDACYKFEFDVMRKLESCKANLLKRFQNEIIINNQ